MVVIAIFVETATPFMDEFWKKFVDLVYPKEKIHLFIYNKVIERLDRPVHLNISVDYRPPSIRCKSSASSLSGAKSTSVSNLLITRKRSMNTRHGRWQCKNLIGMLQVFNRESNFRGIILSENIVKRTTVIITSV